MSKIIFFDCITCDDKANDDLKYRLYDLFFNWNGVTSFEETESTNRNMTKEELHLRQ